MKSQSQLNELPALFLVLRCAKYLHVVCPSGVAVAQQKGKVERRGEEDVSLFQADSVNLIFFNT